MIHTQEETFLYGIFQSDLVFPIVFMMKMFTLIDFDIWLLLLLLFFFKFANQQKKNEWLKQWLKLIDWFWWSKIHLDRWFSIHQKIEFHHFIFFNCFNSTNTCGSNNQFFIHIHMVLQSILKLANQSTKFLFVFFWQLDNWFFIWHLTLLLLLCIVNEQQQQQHQWLLTENVCLFLFFRVYFNI